MKNEMYFLKDKISESGVKAPGDMDERYVLDTLRDVTLKPIEPEPKVKKKFNWKPLVAAAAVVLVAAVGTVIGVRIYQQNLIKDSTVTLNGGLSLRRFNSYDELQDEVNRIRNERKKTDAGEIISGISDFLSGSYGAKSDNDNGGYVSDGMAAESSRSGSASDSHSETYKQVDGVDEADIIKTDGKYIYCADGSYITIFSAEGDKSQKVATLNTKTQNNATADQADRRPDFDYEGYYCACYVSDLYLNGDRMIAVCKDNSFYGDMGYTTVVRVYDISDVYNIKELDSMTQSGYYTSSRMIGDMLYTVSSYTPYSNRYVPYCGTGDHPEEIPADCIYSVEKPDSERSLIVSAYDTMDFSAQTESKVIFGGAEDIYCNLENLYVYATDYDYSDHDFFQGFYPKNAKSRILKINLTDGLSFTAYTEVDGVIDDQYALDEYNGNLRVATTSNNSRRDVNNLFVLDENLSVIGSVKDFAADESIRAVRYVDDTAYVITYEQTDPLFVIDLSDPTAPAILGEVKISGFSTMLVPIDENTVLGLGYYTQEEDYTDLEVQEGLKLALFDVSDKAHPQVLDSLSFVEYDSPVQYDPKALVYNRSRNDFVIPLNYHHYGYYDYDKDVYHDDDCHGGMLNFKVEDGKLKVTDRYQADYTYDVERCVYVGDTVYMTYQGNDGLALDSVILSIH